jgi:hypothetical protein
MEASGRLPQLAGIDSSVTSLYDTYCLIVPVVLFGMAKL